MLTGFDKELYPDDCDVVEIPHHNLYLYRILKNGWSTIGQLAEQHHYRVFRNQEISQLPAIDVLIRPPRPRYIAGICMFVQTVMRDHPHLDADTCIWFANRYSFLNRHYITQFHWLVNLARWLDPSTKMRFYDWSLLATLTDHNDKASRLSVDAAWLPQVQSWLPDKEFWFLLDDILLGLQGQSLTWQEILQVFRQHPCDPFGEFQGARQVYDVLR